jgi:hypothetical protein
LTDFTVDGGRWRWRMKKKMMRIGEESGWTACLHFFDLISTSLLYDDEKIGGMDCPSWSEILVGSRLMTALSIPGLIEGIDQNIRLLD